MTGSRRSDTVVTADLIESLRHVAEPGRPGLDLSSIVVQVVGGVVVLSGTVDNAEQRRAAETAAARVPGVVEVDNRLDVRPDRSRPDARIVEDVREALLRDARVLDATGILVVVQDGRVVLRGVVTRDEDRHLAEGNARFVAGVRSVDNRIQVAPRMSRA
jgi:osmotically-inducible protein OsmY